MSDAGWSTSRRERWTRARCAPSSLRCSRAWSGGARTSTPLRTRCWRRCWRRCGCGPSTRRATRARGWRRSRPGGSSTPAAARPPATAARRRHTPSRGPPTPRRATTAPGVDECGLVVGAIDQAGGYVERQVDLRAHSSEVFLRYPGVFRAGATSAVVLEWKYATDAGSGAALTHFLQAVTGGRLTATVIERTSGKYLGQPDGIRVTRGTSSRGWGAFTDLVRSSYSRGYTVYRDRLYGLTRTGVLYRYTRPVGATFDIPWRNTGRVAGFGAVKGLTLIGQNATSDVLLANTATGSLITIGVTVNGAMRTTTTPVRDGGWNGLEFLVADRCNQRAQLPTALVGIDADTGAAYGYMLGFARGRGTTITPAGRVGAGWKDATYATANWLLAFGPLGGG